MSFVQLLISSVICNVIANILLKKGVVTIGGVTGDKSQLVADITKAATNPFIIFGLVLYGISFLLWLRVLTISDLSRSYPIFVSIVFLLTTIGSFFFLKEVIPTGRIIGILIIIAGIILVAKN